MIPIAKAEHVQRLLSEGRLSHRAIAKEAGVGRATVDRLARGDGASLVERQSRAEPEVPVTMLPIARCPACGVLVTPPCLACRTRRLMGGLSNGRTAA
jgi:hypothetical protein